MAKVTRKQYTTKHCFVCGEHNVAGIKVRFYETENNEVAGVFTADPLKHASYPGRVHGGVISAILDETVGRAVEMEEPGTFGVTMELTVRYRKPVPVGVELICKGRLTQNRSRMFIGEGEIYLPDGTVAATGKAIYLRLTMDQITEGVTDADEEFYYHSYPDDKTEID